MTAKRGCAVCGPGRCVCRIRSAIARILPPPAPTARLSGVHPLTPGPPDYGRLKAANAHAALAVQRARDEGRL